VGAVDNAAARRALAATIEAQPWYGGIGQVPGRVWLLDCGNGPNSGQVLLGNAARPEALRGAFPPGDRPTHRDADVTLIRTGRARRYPAPDGKLTFDKLSSVFAAGNRTRDDQPDHIRIQRTVPQDLAELWTHMCPAQVYAVGESAGGGDVHVEVTPSNCVQCGAITAKGGRLTPPEGGSGPEYTLT